MKINWSLFFSVEMLWNNVPCISAYVKYYTNKTDLTNILNFYLFLTNLLLTPSEYLEYVKMPFLKLQRWLENILEESTTSVFS